MEGGNGGDGRGIEGTGDVFEVEEVKGDEGLLDVFDTVGGRGVEVFFSESLKDGAEVYLGVSGNGIGIGVLNGDLSFLAC